MSSDESEKIELREGASMSEFQRYVHELEAQQGWLDVDLVHNGFLMTEEVGELFKAIRKYEGFFDDSTAREGARANAAEEIVDVLNYLLAIANRLGIDVEAAFRAKNQTRTWKHRGT